jgi:hypothetical protein
VCVICPRLLRVADDRRVKSNNTTSNAQPVLETMKKLKKLKSYELYLLLSKLIMINTFSVYQPAEPAAIDLLSNLTLRAHHYSIMIITPKYPFLQHEMTIKSSLYVIIVGG